MFAQMEAFLVVVEVHVGTDMEMHSNRCDDQVIVRRSNCILRSRSVFDLIYIVCFLDLSVLFVWFRGIAEVLVEDIQASKTLFVDIHGNKPVSSLLDHLGQLFTSLLLENVVFFSNAKKNLKVFRYDDENPRISTAKNK